MLSFSSTKTQVLLLRAVLTAVSAQPELVLGIALPQVQDLITWPC